MARAARLPVRACLMASSHLAAVDPLVASQSRGGSEVNCVKGARHRRQHEPSLPTHVGDPVRRGSSVYHRRLWILDPRLRGMTPDGAATATAIATNSSRRLEAFQRARFVVVELAGLG